MVVSGFSLKNVFKVLNDFRTEDLVRVRESPEMSLNLLD